ATGALLAVAITSGFFCSALATIGSLLVTVVFFVSTFRDLAKIESKNDMARLCSVMGMRILIFSELLSQPFHRNNIKNKLKLVN
ncbi:MAG: hypothetical protein ACPH9H_06400, partial [Porticoccaceae bacterium]